MFTDSHILFLTFRIRVALCLLLSAARFAAAGGEINLAREKNGGRVTCISSEARRGARRFLNDGDGGPVSIFAFSEKAPLPQAITFGFPDNQAAQVHRLVIHQPFASAFREQCVERFEVYVSRVSATSGFESCGEFAYDFAHGSPQSFDLGDRPARFVRLVVTATGTGAGGVRLGEVEIWGTPLPEQTRIISRADENDLITTLEHRTQGLVKVEITPLEKQLLADTRDFRLDKHGLMQASLIASGTKDDAELGRLLGKFDAFAEKLRRSGRFAMGGPRARAEAIFGAMHEQLLSAYMSEISDMRELLEKGEYNCVSASILFSSLAERFRLTVSVEDLSGHVLTRLHGGGESFYVETTIPEWFRLDAVQKKMAFHDLAGDRPGQGRRLTPLGLVSMIYFNRGALYLKEGRYREAVGANMKAMMIDPGSPEALDNLSAAYIKFAFHLARQKQYDEALRALSDAQEIFPYRFALRVARDVIEEEQGNQGP